MTVKTRSSRPQSTDFSALSGSPAFRSPRPDGVSSLDGLSPAMGDSWASMVNTPLLPMFQKPSSSAVNNNNNNATSHGQTVDLATAKLNDLYGAGNVPRLDGPEKFRRSSKGHMHDNTSGGPTTVNNGVTNNGVYGDDGDLISGHRTSSRGGSGGSLRNGGGGGGGGSNWSGAQSPALSNTSGRFGSSDDGSNAMAAAAQQQAALAGLGMGVGGFNLGLGSPDLGGMPNGLSMAQLAQLNGMNGMNPFNMNMLGMANLSAMGISPEAQLLAAQIAAAGGGFGQPGLGLGGGLGEFAGMQVVAVWVCSARTGPVRRPFAGLGPQRQRQEWLIRRRRRKQQRRRRWRRCEERRRRFRPCSTERCRGMAPLAQTAQIHAEL